MKAAVYTAYGSPDVIYVEELERPTPKPNEVLIKIYAATVSSGDNRMRSLKMPHGFGVLARLMFGLLRPRSPILGVDFAGEVAMVGKDVTQFKTGDRIFGICGMKVGCHAEYKCIREDAAIMRIPPTISYDEAAAIPFGGTTALTFLRDKAHLQHGEKVLVIGASGAVGVAAVQLAKAMGATVTGVCSASNVEFVKSLGADDVIDYTASDFTKNGKTYDIILDTVGRASYGNCKDSLSEKGRLLLIAAGLPAMLSAPIANRVNAKKVIAGAANENAADLQFIIELVAMGKFKPIIGQRYPLEKISEAHAMVDSGRKRGNVVVTFTHDTN